MDIHIGNLPRQTTEDDLRQAFEAFGQAEEYRPGTKHYRWGGKGRGGGSGGGGCGGPRC